LSPIKNWAIFCEVNSM